MRTSQGSISLSQSNTSAAVLNPSKPVEGTGNLEDGELMDDSALDMDRALQQNADAGDVAMEDGMPRQAAPKSVASARSQQIGTTGVQGGSQGTGRKRDALGDVADDDDAPAQNAVDEDNAAEREDPQMIRHVSCVMCKCKQTVKVNVEEGLPSHESMAWEVVQMLAATAQRPHLLEVQHHLEDKFRMSLGCSQQEIFGFLATIMGTVQEACCKFVVPALQHSLVPATMTAPQLRQQLHAFGLPLGGRQAELVHRLQTALAAAALHGSSVEDDDSLATTLAPAAMVPESFFLKCIGH
ncbi:hypothetical protein ABBQ38_014838 [Trebouxia sp. C0009 RCD-2024]